MGRDGSKWSQLCTRSVVVLRISGAAILLTAVGFNLFGDGIRDLLDPKAGGKQS
nr:Probable D,D-dipeptide transport system permease protein ddpC [Escherichia coli]